MARLTKEKKLKIIEAFKNGISANTIAAGYDIDYDLAVKIQETIVAETKQESNNHRILIRQTVRNQIPQALQTLSRISSGKEPDLQTKEGMFRCSLRIKAATSILNFAKDFVGDNILQMLNERPDYAERNQLTIFDFEARVDEDGSTRLSAKPRLVVDNDANSRRISPEIIEAEANE